MYFPSDFRRVKGRTVGAIVDHGYADKMIELSEVRGTSVSTEVRRAIREYVDREYPRITTFEVQTVELPGEKAEAAA